MAISLQRSTAATAILFSASFCVLGNAEGLRLGGQLRGSSICLGTHCIMTYSLPMAAIVSVFVLLALEYIRRKIAAGVTFPWIGEAIKSLPMPAVSYGTMTPDPNAGGPAIDPPRVPTPEAAKVPEANAPEAKAPEPDHGLTAPLSEVGYSTVAALRSNEQTKIYVKRVLENLGGRLESEDSEEFSHFVSEYSGVDFVRSFRRMIDALRRAPWVIYEKAAPRISGVEGAMTTVGDTAFFLPCVGGEGAVLMNEDGRPAVANIDLILKGLTKDARIANEDEGGDREQKEREEEKSAQVQSCTESFKADDVAKRLGLVLPLLPSPNATPEAREVNPDAIVFERLAPQDEDSIVQPQDEDQIITFTVFEGFAGQVGLIPGARPPHPCFVKAIVPGSWADTCGVRVEDEILAVNGIAVSELDRNSFHEEMQKRPLDLSIRTQAPPLLDEI